MTNDRVWRSMGARRRLLMTISLCLLAGPAMAQSTSLESLQRELAKQGYQVTEVRRTWLGRIQVISSANGVRRETVLTGNGSVLRDVVRRSDSAGATTLLEHDQDNRRSTRGGLSGSASGGSSSRSDSSSGGSSSSAGRSSSGGSSASSGSRGSDSGGRSGGSSAGGGSSGGGNKGGNSGGGNSGGNGGGGGNSGGNGNGGGNGGGNSGGNGNGGGNSGGNGKGNGR